MAKLDEKTTKSIPSKSNLSSEKLLKLIETMAENGEPMRLQKLSKELSVNASTVLRFLSTLQSTGYVTKDSDTGAYSLTLKLCGIAQNLNSNINVRNIAMPYLRSLSKMFKEAVNLTIERDMEVIYVEVIKGPQNTLQSIQRIGHVAPMHCTGAGKLFLQDYDPIKIKQYIASKGLPKFTEHTITTEDELVEIIKIAKINGYCFDNEECEIGMRCIAAPVRDFTGKVVACISVSGPISRMSDITIFENLPFLLEAASELSVRMGYDSQE